MTIWYCPYCDKEHYDVTEPCCGEVGHLLLAYRRFYTHCGHNWSNVHWDPNEPDVCVSCGLLVDPNHYEAAT